MAGACVTGLPWNGRALGSQLVCHQDQDVGPARQAHAEASGSGRRGSVSTTSWVAVSSDGVFAISSRV